MRGQKSVATAVRSSDGKIVVESSRISQEKKWWMKVPILRGFINFFYMMIIGSRVLMRSAEVYGEDVGEPSKFEVWLSKKSKYSVMDIAIFIGVLLGVVMAVGLFIALPLGVVKLFELIPGFKDLHYVWRNLIASGLKLIVLLGYLSLVALMKDIKRVYQYHGAEHKVISCFEHGLDLTVENAKKMPRIHDRCGTSFLVITVFVSVLCTAFLPAFDNYNGIASFLLRFVTRLALLPVVAGLAYEILKGLAKFDNPFVRGLKAPGLWFQRLTTREPDESMLEVSLTAFKTVMAMDEDDSIPTTRFDIKKDYKLARNEVLTTLAGVEEAETIADWLFVEYAGVARSELALLDKVNEEVEEKALAAAKRIKEGEPMQYVLGNAEFYGLNFKVDSRVLVPRSDTETLVEKALSVIESLPAEKVTKSKKVSDSGEETVEEKKTPITYKVLDMCTGSGCIAVSVKAKATHNIEMTAVDVSEDALAVAKENAENNGANVEFICSDLFSAVKGKYDIILSNPPYIPTADIKGLSAFVQKEPKLALDGGVDGLNVYRKIAEEAPSFIKDGGMMLLEIGCDQAAAVKDLLSAKFDVEVLKDLSGNDRVIVAKAK